MITLQVAEDLSEVLRKVLPSPNPVVDFHASHNVWDQAILESLATFAADGKALPVDVRQAVEEFIGQDGVSPKFVKRARYQLGRIPS
jgi:hypothetical protein